MKTRIISGVVGVIVLILALTTFNSLTFNVLAVILYAIALSEIRNTFKENNSNAVFATMLAMGAYFLLQPYVPQVNPMVILCLFMVAYSFIVVTCFHTMDFKNVSASFLFGGYVLIGLYSILNMKTNMPFAQFGWDATFMFILCCGIAWGADIFAYFAGYFFGKHKLAPTLSPKKTKEGAVGGVLGSVALTWLLFVGYASIKPMLEGTTAVYAINGRQLAMLAVLAVFGSVLGMIGDLFASAVKRQTGIKDYGNIMPGHGGVLDRFDSVLLVSPFVSMLSVVVVARGGVFNV